MFPTADKLKLSLQFPIKTLIINGSECEPYLTCDDRLMREQGELILGGLHYMMQMTGASEAFIGIEGNNKPAALAQMDALCADEPEINVVELPALYPYVWKSSLLRPSLPASAQRQLSADIGVLRTERSNLHRSSSAFALCRPLTHRVITVSGDALLNNQVTFWRRSACPIRKSYPNVAASKTISGSY